MKWSKAEEQALQLLIQRLGKGDWEKVAKQFNCIFPRRKKTLQQCRDKFQDIYQINSKTAENMTWTAEEQSLLRSLYLERGSSWSSFLQFLPDKTIKSIKNKFYNKLRIFSKKFITYQSLNNSCRNPLTYENIIVFLQLCAKIQKWIVNHNYRRSSNSLIFGCRQTLLNLIFEVEKIQESSVVNKIIVDLKHINSQLKCLGIFKSKYRKTWHLNQQRAKFILQIDQIIQNQEQIFRSWFRLMKKENDTNQGTNKVEQSKNIKQEMFEEIVNFPQVKNQYIEIQPKIEQLQYNFIYDIPYIHPMMFYPYW